MLPDILVTVAGLSALLLVFYAAVFYLLEFRLDSAPGTKSGSKA